LSWLCWWGGASYEWLGRLPTRRSCAGGCLGTRRRDHGAVHLAECAAIRRATLDTFAVRRELLAARRRVMHIAVVLQRTLPFQPRHPDLLLILLGTACLQQQRVLLVPAAADLHLLSCAPRSAGPNQYPARHRLVADSKRASPCFTSFQPEYRQRPRIFLH
jgi:hypothetical protein